MKTKEIIGIDVSKSLVDVCIHSKQFFNQFKNDNTGFKQMWNWILRNFNNSKPELLFVFEHTGMYSYNLTTFLSKKELPFYIASGLAIKRSLGIARGKDDQVDAKRIASYGNRLKDELTPSKVSNDTILKLKGLMSLRNKLIKQRAGFKATLKEQKMVYSTKQYKTIFRIQQKMIKALSEQIDKLDATMKIIIKEDQQLKKTYDLVTSVKGIGMQMALVMIIYTDCFTKFENWRKFASYCGVAPFPYQSGSSIKGRTKVSHLANKKIKALINMCAISAIQHNPEIKQYYERRLEIGKNKMSTINIIRNKLISRVFAVIKRQTPYVNTMKFAA